MPLTFQQQNITHAPYGFQRLEPPPFTSLDRQRAAQSLAWIESQLKGRGSNQPGYGLTVTNDPTPPSSFQGAVTGNLTLPSGLPLANVPVAVTTPDPIPDLYTGNIDGTATYNADYVVQAFLVTDQPYLQGTVPISPAGLWTFAATGLAGRWMFQLRDTLNNVNVGSPWLQTFPNGYFADLELRLYSVTDAPYLQSTSRVENASTPTFALQKNDAGVLRLELFNTATLTTLAVWVGQTNLVRSYAFQPGDPGYGTPLEDRCYTYDQALALLAAISIWDDLGSGDPVYAAPYPANLEALIETLCAGLVATQAVNGAFPFSTSHLDPQGFASEPVYRTGAHAWCMYALAEYALRFPVAAQYNGAHLALRNSVTWLETKRNTTPGVVEQFTFSGGNNGYTGVGGAFQTFTVPWHSTEHNLDTYFALRAIRRACDVWGPTNSAYNPSSFTEWQLALDMQFDMTIPFIENYWRSSVNRAAQGLTGSNAQDTADALDTNSWFAIFLNAAISDVQWDNATRNEYLARRNHALERMAVYGAAANDGAVQVGNGYSPYSPFGGYPGAQPTVWGEGSFGVALALFRAGHYDAYDQTLDDLEFERNLDGSYGYAAVRDDTYEITTAPSVASTGWFVIATLGRDTVWGSEPRFLYGEIAQSTLTAVAQSSSSILVTFNSTDPNVYALEVAWKTGPGPFANILTYVDFDGAGNPGVPQTYLHTGLQPGTEYTYALLARYGLNEIGDTITANATTANVDTAGIVASRENILRGFTQKFQLGRPARFGGTAKLEDDMSYIIEGILLARGLLRTTLTTGQQGLLAKGIKEALEDPVNWFAGQDSPIRVGTVVVTRREARKIGGVRLASGSSGDLACQIQYLERDIGIEVERDGMTNLVIPIGAFDGGESA